MNTILCSSFIIIINVYLCILNIWYFVNFNVTYLDEYFSEDLRRFVLIHGWRWLLGKMAREPDLNAESLLCTS